MNKKVLFAVMLGMLAAGVVCLIVGIGVYYGVKNNAIAMLTGVFAMAMGAIIAGAAAIVLLIFLLINLIIKLRNK